VSYSVFLSTRKCLQIKSLRLFNIEDDFSEMVGGVAYYKGNSVQIFKEPKCALDSELADFLKRYKDSIYGVVFASNPITTEKWTQPEPGQLIVVKDGDIVYESNK
jgi:predicted glutamine amidotransferase